MRSNRKSKASYWETSKPNLLLVILIFFFVVTGCFENSNQRNEKIANAEIRGRADGLRDAKASGNTAYASAKDAAYNEKIDKLIESGEFNRKWAFAALIICTTFLLGFGLQYSLLCLLRKKAYLRDIDWIVLSKKRRPADLRSWDVEKSEDRFSDAPKTQDG